MYISEFDLYLILLEKMDEKEAREILSDLMAGVKITCRKKG